MGMLSTIAEIWLAIGVVLVILEVVLPGIFLLWLGLAAIGTGLVMLAVVISFGVQVVLFAVLALVSVGVALRRTQQRRGNGINQPGSGLIGRRATAMWFSGTEGRVRVGDSDWPARLANGEKVAPGATLVVTAVDGMVLLVQMAEG